MKIQDVMTTAVRTCRASDPMSTAAAAMWEADCGCVPVIDGAGRPVGVITDRDVCMAAYTQGKTLADMSVASAMSRAVFVCRADDALADAERIMREHRVRRLPVVDDDDGAICGIVSLNDVVRATQRTTIRKARETLAGDVLQTMAALCEPRVARSTAAE